MERWGIISIFMVLVSGGPAYAEPASTASTAYEDYFGNSPSTLFYDNHRDETTQIPNSSISQLLYKPNIRTDIPYTSIYRSIYGDTGEGQRDDSADFRSPFENDPFLNADPFKRKSDLDFRAPVDILGAQKALRDTHLSEQALGCGPNFYVSQDFNAKTLSYESKCVSLDGSRELAADSETNSYLDSSDDSEKNFGDKYSFASGVYAESKSVNATAKGISKYEQLKMQISPEILEMVERYAANNPYLQEILSELQETGDVRGAFRKIREGGGLQGLMQGMPQGMMFPGAAGLINP